MAVDEFGNEIKPENIEQAENTENAEPNNEGEKKEERVFTQAELDDILTKRLERDREATTKRVAQEARDTFIAEQGHTFNGKPITTEAEFKQAQIDQQIIDQYREKELPEDVIHKLVEGENYRKQVDSDNAVKLTQKKAASDFDDFVKEYKDVTPDLIPQNVWDEVNNGARLVDAYARHENQSLKQKLATIEQLRVAAEQNDSNAESSTGSTKTKGDGKPAFFTLEQVKAMTQVEANKNYKAIIESQKKWY